MIDKKFSPDFRIRIQDDGWATIFDDVGYIELAPDEVALLRNFLAEGPGAERPEQDPPINHSEAEELAHLKKSESNLARCYLDLLGKGVNGTGEGLDLEAMDRQWRDLIAAGGHTKAAMMVSPLMAEIRRLRGSEGQA